MTTWDSSNTEELIDYSIKHKLRYKAFELGNEQNTMMSGAEQAKVCCVDVSVAKSEVSIVEVEVIRELKQCC